MNDTIEKIDTSLWKTKDPDWVNQRTKNWEFIEYTNANWHKPLKKNMNPVKDYYFRGKMPNWSMYKKWENSDGHLDLFFFLSLHPSSDESLLTNLRNLYVYSDRIMARDVQKGFAILFNSTISEASANRDKSEYHKLGWPHIAGKSELLFKIMMGNNYDEEFKYKKPLWFIKRRTEYDKYTIPKGHFSSICSIANWLMISDMQPVHNEFLFQFEQPMQWWYESVRYENYFDLSEYNRKGKQHLYKDLPDYP